MLSKNELKSILKNQREMILQKEDIVKRDILDTIDINLPFVSVLSGIRRCGKSTLLKEIILQQKNFYYVNFEDPNMAKFRIGDVNILENSLKEEFGEADCYFFDEIQNLEKWESFVRYLLDRKKKVVITGSNASLLSIELGTKLTGRHLSYNIFPFSYNEFLRIEKTKPSEGSFSEYMKSGGFPEYLKCKKQNILQELFKDVIARDILVRHRIRDSKRMFSLAVYLFTNIGNEFSYRKLAKMLSLNSVNTAISYVNKLEDSYMFFTIPRFSYSLNKQQVSPKKIYSIDNGLLRVNASSFSGDRGKLLENVVFLQLKRKYEEIFYFQEEGECDFAVKEKNKISRAFQVCYEMNDDNEKREINGLKEAMDKFNLRTGLILTYNQDDEIKTDGKSISVRPVWKWLTE